MANLWCSVLTVQIPHNGLRGGKKRQNSGEKKHTGRKESLFSCQQATEASHAEQNLKWIRTTVCVCVSGESSLCEYVLEHPSSRCLLCQVNVCDIFEKDYGISAAFSTFLCPKAAVLFPIRAVMLTELDMTWQTLLNEFLLKDFLLTFPHPQKVRPELQVLNRCEILSYCTLEDIYKHQEHNNLNLYTTVLQNTLKWC